MTPYYADDHVTVWGGDCIEVMATMDPESVDAIVTDPPYLLDFMGKTWDSPAKMGGHSQPNPDVVGFYQAIGTGGGAHDRGHDAWKPNLMQQWHARWAEAAYRVAKPSAYLLAFGGPRTVHRMTVALEDAGWIIRDMLVWGYASGFPKSKAQLKPAYEPIVMARKPGPLRKLNIDACRLPISDQVAETIRTARGFMQAGWDKPETGIYGTNTGEGMPTIDATAHPLGRWPANVILTATEDGRAIFDGGIEGVVGGGAARGAVSNSSPNGKELGIYGAYSPRDLAEGYGDSGTYSRFFIVPKASRADREPTIDEYAYRLHRERGECDTADAVSATSGPSSSRNVCGRCGKPLPRVGSHPTVKPTELMRHLVRLVTPIDGVVLDPFAGSGSTLLAAEMEGFASIGIEQEPEYLEIIRARLNGSQRGLGLREASR